MRFKLIAKIAMLLSAVLMLSQCNKMTEAHLHVNKELITPYTLPAAAYLAMANNQVGSERQNLLILAAGRSIYDGQWQKGLEILSQTDALTTTQSDQKNILLAKANLSRGQAQVAINTLAKVKNVNSLPTFYQAQFHEMLAYAFQMLGNPTQSLLERIKLGHILPDDASKANNRRLLWLTLMTLPVAELNAMSIEIKPNTELDGWIQLALIPRQYGEQSQKMLEAVEAWVAHHPHHPANLMLPSPLNQVGQGLFVDVKKIALLLPVTGPLSGPGNAIRDGFMAAFNDSTRKNTLDIRVYDTYNKNSVALYHKAIEEGAQFVIGPLSKADVTKVAAITHPVPTLLLNDIDGKMKANAYQFGLSPRNEAKQVAATARKEGYARALIIAPSGSWGDEVSSAFMKQWQLNGGEVVDTLRFNTQDNLQKAIQKLLKADDSKKIKKSDANLAQGPRRRQDFDMIFLLAYPSKARQIMPTLRYYFAANVPVYATSSVYSGSMNSQQDRDLDGLLFCDMPWVFTHQLTQQHWPEQLNSYSRLYAIGMDSFALTTKLNQLMIFPAMGASEQSGILYLNPNRQIARVLTWGQFRQGLAVERREKR